MLAREIGLTGEARIELAEMILRRDVPSWSNLRDEEVVRIADALEGYEKISHLLLDVGHQ